MYVFRRCALQLLVCRLYLGDIFIIPFCEVLWVKLLSAPLVVRLAALLHVLQES